MIRSNYIRVISVVLISLALIVGAAWAATIEIPVSGTQLETIIDPGVQWTDEEGITHYRGLAEIADFEGQDIDGTAIAAAAYYVMNIDIDLVTGDGDINIIADIEGTYGDLSGSWSGRAVGAYSGFVINGTFNYPRCDGDFDGWHFRGIWTNIFGELETQWEGVFQIPGGGGGDKSGASESETWSSVKALYR